MRTGWEIVITGRDFDPTEFFRESKIQPCRMWQREIEEDGITYSQKGIEFTDWREELYLLDMATEAIDFLEAHREEFEKLCRLPGIDDRLLNFVQESGEDFDFSAASIELLASLGFSISITVVVQGKDSHSSQQQG